MALQGPLGCLQFFGGGQAIMFKLAAKFIAWPYYSLILPVFLPFFSLHC